jgi:HEAT repeat protein
MKKRRSRAIEEDIIPVEQTIAGLADSNQPLLNARLADLSDLSSQQLSLLDDVWQRIEPKRQRQIMQRLIELADDDVCLNFDAIFKHRLRDADEEVRRTAIEGLWESEQSCLIKPLTNLMEKDSSLKVREAAAQALGKFTMLAEHRKIAADYKPLLSRALLATFADSSKPIELRRRALEAVAPLSLPQGTEAITEAYHNGNAALKASAIYAMGKNCDRRWLPILMTELAATNAEARYEAATACGELGEEAAVPNLIALTHDADPDVRMAAVQALGKIGGSEAREHLEKCLNQPSEAIRQAAIQALHKLELTTEPLSPYDIGYGELND